MRSCRGEAYAILLIEARAYRMLLRHYIRAPSFYTNPFYDVGAQGNAKFFGLIAGLLGFLSKSCACRLFRKRPSLLRCVTVANMEQRSREMRKFYLCTLRQIAFYGPVPSSRHGNCKRGRKTVPSQHQACFSCLARIAAWNILR